MAVPATIGVVGAGTMGAGIAQLAAQAGAATLLHDPDPAALERGIALIAKGLGRLEAKGRLGGATADEVLARVSPVASLEELAPCGMVIEAVPERLALKLDVLGRVAAAVGDDCVLATNTSSLAVTEIAAGLPGPERVVGLHFFNPAPVMRLVEVVPGVASSPRVVQVAREVGEAMGKHVIDAADVAGFLVNRVNRPFFLEALQLLQEQVATEEQIDRIVRMGGGFRMGPFELMDLIGIETNHAVAEGFHRQTFGEPRYRPSPLAARKVAAGHLGRKSGQGWYRYVDGVADKAADPAPPAAGGGGGRSLLVVGDLPVLDELAAAAADAGFAVARDAAEAPAPWLVVAAAPAQVGAPTALLLHASSLHAADPTAAGLHLVAPSSGTTLVELTSTPRTDPDAASRLEELVRALGRHPEWVGDAPGLVLGRIVGQLVNEAAFLVGEGNGTPADVDAGLELGLNHPRGPVAWADALGLAHVVALLDGLLAERGDPRYRTAPLLRRRLALDARLG
jgi:3-hydroxybutyryl-CoA dehydrogenase